MIYINRKLLGANPFTIAISGGVDSLACMHFLLCRRYKFNACHFNHNQRSQNDKMEDACIRFCKDFKIPLTLGKCVVNYAKDIENNLREERLKFFGEVGGSIVCCQHLNDCVESYIMNMMRGCPEYISIPQITKFDNFTIIRPFIRNKKSEFESWVKNKRLGKYLEVDETNNDTKYERNWVRNVIIPEIEKRRGLEKVVLKKFYM